MIDDKDAKIFGRNGGDDDIAPGEEQSGHAEADMGGLTGNLDGTLIIERKPHSEWKRERKGIFTNLYSLFYLM